MSDLENPTIYFTQLLRQRFGKVKYSVLPLSLVTDESFYFVHNGTQKTQNKDIGHVHVIRGYSQDRNGYSMDKGKERRIKQAMMAFDHWFIEENKYFKCDYNKVVKAEKSVWNMS